MRTPTIKSKRGPEFLIQQRIIKYLHARGWYVIIMTASLYVKGFPDLFATHRVYGPKLIEVKNPKSYKFTKDQKIVFPQLLGHGTPIYIMFEADKENYASLFRECNCPHYIAMKGY